MHNAKIETERKMRDEIVSKIGGLDTFMLYKTLGRSLTDKVRFISRKSRAKNYDRRHSIL